MNKVNVSVTDLASYISRRGNLAGGSYGSVSGVEGTRLHQRVFSDLKKAYGDVITTEESLNYDYISETGMILSVSGRIDAMMLNTGKPPMIFEIKSFNSTKDSFEALVRPEHVTQLKLYGAMYLLTNSDVLDVRLTLRYVSITTLESFENTYEMSFETANKLWEDICSEYCIFAQTLLDYQNSLLDTVSQIRFPFDTIRPGQKEFMKKALLALNSQEAFFVEAPTGIGKTVSVLYPAIKGLVKNRYDKIFYLTAKEATRGVAESTVNQMRRSGLIIRSITLRSKEKMCPFGTECDAKFCPLAKDYYGKLKAALAESLVLDEITPEKITEIALRHGICPHEFMLDTMNYCTVVIGDYNHIFSPRVSMISKEPGNQRIAVLVDEAHNMIDRGRDMFSASFSLSLIDEMLQDFKGRDTKIETMIHQLRNYFVNIGTCFDSSSSCFKLMEEADEHKVLMTENWEAMRQPPRQLYAKLWYTISRLSPVLDRLEQGQCRRTSMKFFFEARYFLTVLEHYFDNAYITTASREGKEITITLNCLDCASKLDYIIRDRMSVIFFSATFTPYEYYRNCLVGPDCDYSSFLRLPSPFPPENLEIMIDSDISTAYKNRSLTQDELASRIAECLKDRTGNHMIFFPSFEYLQQIMPRLSNELTSKGVSDFKIISQITDMTSIEKENFLKSFSEPYKGLLIGAAVLGGHFGEGIDLVGDKLTGVVIVGVGLPKITPERQILSNYYSERFGDGFAFAYRFPGWQKVLQAVGRVIRTETDTGFALLIDSRLANPEYTMLFPDHWKI
ncbi:ATP-dependent DNA helicase [Butyrivibrio sp. AE2032]|uniref:ATP-dependent DNA helicase n=1 Tax=Butyrivibrio sp. AE2032 TaxID=1458463 RepID=UPI00054EE17F|nr:ATP-dependent DNA helicase [Butyrivibrio sp. AE2032]